MDYLTTRDRPPDLHQTFMTLTKIYSNGATWYDSDLHLHLKWLKVCRQFLKDDTFFQPF